MDTMGGGTGICPPPPLCKVEVLLECAVEIVVGVSRLLALVLLWFGLVSSWTLRLFEEVLLSNYDSAL